MKFCMELAYLKNMHQKQTLFTKQTQFTKEGELAPRFKCCMFLQRPSQWVGSRASVKMRPSSIRAFFNWPGACLGSRWLLAFVSLFMLDKRQDLPQDHLHIIYSCSVSLQLSLICFQCPEYHNRNKVPFTKQVITSLQLAQIWKQRYFSMP